METVPGTEQPEGTQRNPVRAGVQRESRLRPPRQGDGWALLVDGITIGLI